MMRIIINIFLFVLLSGQIPESRVVAEWEPALGTMIRWPLGIPSDLVIELSQEDKLYVLVENSNQENAARNSFNSWNVSMDNVVFIYTSTYSHWTRDHGPQFLIGENSWKVVNQQFNGYPEEPGCVEQCDPLMIMFDCSGTEFCNDQPEYASDGYDCYVNNEFCEDFNGDGQIMDWVGDGYCDDGSWGLDFLCDEYSWDCGDCGGVVTDENGYCDEMFQSLDRLDVDGRPTQNQVRYWDEDDDTNIDFADQMDWDLLDLPLYWTGGNFMTDGYGQGFSTELMVNENDINQNEFTDLMSDYMNFYDYHIFENPNESSIQHIDCLAKLVGPETIIIKQVPESSPEYDCIEEFADSFNDIETSYGRSFEIHRLYCPEINGGSWEYNPVAAYTNSLILNNKVLVPQYGIVEDNLALQLYRDAMPGYDIIGFDGASGNPWYSEDALHCRTMGIFDPEMMHISHMSIRTEDVLDNSDIYVEAETIDYGNLDADFESVSVFWKYEPEDGPYGEFSLEHIGNGMYSGQFPGINSSSDIEYYIQATNSLGESITHPNAGWHTFTSQDGIYGDLNSDTNIDILDVVILVNHILSPAAVELDGADLNGDSVENILDVIILINLILS